MKKYLTGENLFIFVVVILFLGVLFRAELKTFILEDSDIANISLRNQASATDGIPVRLLIPAIGIDVEIESLGLTEDRAMDSPKDRFNVAWYNLGARPGDMGSAVIAGHTNWKNGMTAVFDNLSQLKIGDKVSVENNNGIPTSFMVERIKVYDSEDIVPEVFNLADGKYLNLITCSGTWNREKNTPTKRLVVFSRMIP